MKRRSLGLVATLALAAPVALMAAGSTPQIVVDYFMFGSTPKDLLAVQDEVNKIALAKIGATVKLNPIAFGSWSQQVNLILASDEQVDLVVTGVGSTNNITAKVAKGQLLPLDELIAKYGAGISSSMDPGFLAAGKINGKQYGVPSVRDFAAALGVDMRRDILDKLKVDPASIKTYDDLAALLRKVKKAYPDLAPIGPGIQGQSLVDYMYSWDTLGDGFGVLMDNGSSLKVVNLYETKEYAALVKRVRLWYQEGLVLKDASTNKEHWSSMVKANTIFAVTTTLKPGIDAQVTKEAGQPMVTSALLPPFSATSNVANVMWSVPRNSKYPDKAMQFLNLMYSDPVLINLLDWGIEGKHYVKQADGLFAYPEGVDAKNTGYGPGLNWLFGNQLISTIWKGDSPTLYKELEAFNKKALKSKALGFTFDSTPVKTEFAAVSNAITKYKLALECGAVDPDKTIPQLNADLKAAGIDKIIAEKQKQLDAWAAANN